MRKVIWCVALSVIPLFTACTPEPESDLDAFATEAPVTTPAAAAEPEGARAAGCSDEAPPAPPKEDTLGTTKPEIKVPDGDPPCELVIQDIHEGEGDEVPEGASVTIKYVGVSWSTGEEFDSSWPDDITFPLGNLIPGWQQGIPGMKEGGRRQLIIPPELAYGPNPDPRSGIAPNETLIFVIDLIEVAG
jgi:peptidylprolyl isomerase